jgi:unsaturated rhamnogalacturonyl hydrolase
MSGTNDNVPASAPTATHPAHRVRPLWQYGFLVLLLLNVGVVSRDWLPRIERRLARRRMADTLDDQHYLRRLAEEARAQLVADRAVAMTDETRLLVLDDAGRLRADPLAFSWPHALLARGVLALDARQPNGATLDALRNYYDKMVSPSGHLLRGCHRLDETAHGSNLIDLAERTKDERYRRAADEMAAYLLSRAAKEGGLLAYTARLRLVDTLGIICPFLAEYGDRYSNHQATDLAVRQLEDFLEYGVDPKTALPFHGLNPDDACCPIGVLGWGRGAGWYGIGLVDTLVWLDKSEPARPALEDALQSLAAALRRYQRPAGGWGALINVDSPYDSSGTAMLAYVLEKGMELGVLPPDYRRDAAAALRSLKCHTRIDGTVDFAQGNLMGLARHSKQFSPEPYAQGMACLAWAEACPAEAHARLVR